MTERDEGYVGTPGTGAESPEQPGQIQSAEPVEDGPAVPGDDGKLAELHPVEQQTGGPITDEGKPISLDQEQEAEVREADIAHGAADPNRDDPQETVEGADVAANGVQTGDTVEETQANAEGRE